MYKTYKCDFCEKHLDTQENAMSCESVIKLMNTKQKDELKQVQYSYLVGSSEQQLKITQVF